MTEKKITLVNCRDILLTKYPRDRSRNVGDQLITESAKKLIRFRVPEYAPEEIFRGTELSEDVVSKSRTILAPGFSINNNTYPELFALCKNFSDIDGKLFPVGCSFQSIDSSSKAYENYQYNAETLKILRALSKYMSGLPCRDIKITEMLKRNGVNSYYIGDLALYDDEVVNKRVQVPNDISSVAFTVQHKSKFFKQSKKLLSLIVRQFPNAKLYVVHHSVPTTSSLEVTKFARSLGFEEIDLSGESQNLDFYQNVDIHIGYRLHGHLFFLRTRKPSFLIAEDSRSGGIARSGKLSNGIFLGMTEDMSINELAPYELMKFYRKQKANNFEVFDEIFKFIDQTYKKVVRPYFDDFSEMLGWKKPIHIKLISGLRAALAKSESV